MSTFFIYVITATVVALVCGLTAKIPSPERPLSAADANPSKADLANIGHHFGHARRELPVEITKALAEVRRDGEFGHTRPLDRRDTDVTGEGFLLQAEPTNIGVFRLDLPR